MSADYNVRALIDANVEPVPPPTGVTAEGVTLADGDKVLVLNQSNSADNRIYTWVASTLSLTPTAGISYAPGFEVRVLDGLTTRMSKWIVFQNATPIVAGTTNMMWFEAERVPAPTPGDGLQFTNGIQYFGLTYRAVAGVFDVGPLSLELTDRGIVNSIAGGYGQETYIQGLTSSYLSTTQFKVAAGAAYNFGSGDNQGLASEQTVSISGAPVSGLLYVYLTNTSTIEPSQTAPDTPYLGTARSMTGDTSRRYIGALRTNASSQPYNFQASALSDNRLKILYLEDSTNSPFRVLTGGSATTNQTVDLGPNGLKLVPPTCRLVYLHVLVNATSGVQLSNSEASVTASLGGIRKVIAAERGDSVWMPLDAAQQFTWANSVAGGSTSIDVLGYIDRR